MYSRISCSNVSHFWQRQKIGFSFHPEKIKKSIQNAIDYQRAVFDERQRSQARAAAFQGPLRDAQEFMQARRRELVAIRRDILTRLSEDARDAPPSYSAIDGNPVVEQREVSSESIPIYEPPPGPPPQELPRLSLNGTHSPRRGHSPSHSFASNNPYRGDS